MDDGDIVTMHVDRPTALSRKSARLQNIPAPHIRTSVSPARAARTGIQTLMTPPSATEFSSCHQSLFSDDEDVPNSDDYNRNKQTPESRLGLPSIKINQWKPPPGWKPVSIPSRKSTCGSCWFCRTRRVRCVTVGGTRCQDCIRSNVECHGKGQPVPKDMRGKGGHERYRANFTLPTYQNTPLSNIGQTLIQSFKPSTKIQAKVSARAQLLTQHTESFHKTARFSESGSRFDQGPDPSASSTSLQHSRIEAGPSSLACQTPAMSMNVLSTARLHPPPRLPSLEIISGADFHTNIGSEHPPTFKREPGTDSEETRMANVGTFLASLDLGHTVSMFHGAHLRSRQHLQEIRENAGNPARIEELWKLLQSKGMHITDWWTFINALSKCAL